MKRFKLLLKTLAIGFGFLTVVLALFILEENIRGKKELQAYIRVLHNKSERLTLDQFEYSKPPPKANAAAAEFVAAGEQLHTMQKDCPFSIEGLNGFKLADYRPRRLGICVVRHQDSDLGQSRIEPHPKFPRPRTPVWKPATWNDLSEQLGRASNVLARIKTTLTRPDLAFRIDFSGSTDTNRPSLWPISDIAHWLGAAALGDLHSGDLNADVENIALIATLTRFQRYEPFMDSPLSSEYGSLRKARTGMYLTWEALQSESVTDDQLAQLQSTWEPHNFTDEVLDVLERERAERLSYFEKVRRSPKAFGKLCWGEMSCCHECGNGGCGLSDYWFDAKAISRTLLWRAAWLDQDELKFLQDWQVCLDQAREAIAHGDRTRFRSNGFPWLPQPDRNNWWLVQYNSRRHLMSHELAPGDELMVLQPMCVETERRMTIVAIALKRYELVHGTWPYSLEELTPTLLSTIPLDYMDGWPLRYRHNDDGTFALYSVGQDCVDDGGSLERDLNHLPNGMMWMTCDAVWPKPAPSTETDQSN